MAAIVSACGPATAPAPAPVAEADAVAAAPHAKTPPRPWPKPAWVGVPVASVWDHLDSARPVDAAAVARAPEVGSWLAHLTYAERLDLDNRLATQALLNDPVTVLGESHGWAHVLVNLQRGAVYRRGIDGWIPASQLTFTAPPSTARTVTVALPEVQAGRAVLSYGTRLPLISQSRTGAAVVATPAGRVALPAGVTRSGVLHPSGASVVQEARRFLGLPYLWAGTSGFGLDCSGLTFLVYRQFGVTLPRDAADQAKAGRAVAVTDLRPGDLLFFAFDGKNIDHVGIYAGGGNLIDAPETGRSVEVAPLAKPLFSKHLVAARRDL
jgi:cell wall-associated NlpC family hydrolase